MIHLDTPSALVHLLVEDRRVSMPELVPLALAQALGIFPVPVW